MVSRKNNRHFDRREKSHNNHSKIVISHARFDMTGRENENINEKQINYNHETTTNYRLLHVHDSLHQ